MKSRILAGAVASLLAVSLPAGAHEIGRTQVTAAIDPVHHTYQVDVVVDPDALLTRLQIRATGDVAPPHDRVDRDRQLSASGQSFLAAVRLKFDSVPATPTFEYRASSAFNDFAQAPSIVRLAGEVPAGSKRLTFTYDLAAGTFALIARIGDSPAQTIWMEGSTESAPISLVAPPPPPTLTDVAVRYFSLGFMHILPKGLDHILFVVGLFLLSTRWRSVLLQVSTFTLAHSITLGLTIYGIVSLPARVVEPMIALSIAYVAIENLVTTEL
jgi:hypothetical protein